MPSEGVELSPNGNILTDEEVVRLATLFVRNGVTKIRLTGGEPTVRKGLIHIIGELSLNDLPATTHPNCSAQCYPGRLNELRKYGLESIGITSNGIALHRKLPDLIEKGLTHLNLR